MVDIFTFLSFAVVNNNTNLRASTKNQFLTTTKKQINFLVFISPLPSYPLKRLGHDLT